MISEVEEFQSRLHDAALSADSCGIFLRCPPELLDLAVRISRGVLQAEGLRSVVYGAPAWHGDVSRYFADWEALVRKAITREAPELRLLGGGGRAEPLDLPAIDASLPLEDRYACWFEQVSVALLPLRRRTVFFAMLDDGLPEQLRVAVRRVARLLAIPSCKLVVLDATSEAQAAQRQVSQGQASQGQASQPQTPSSSGLRSLPCWTSSALMNLDGDARSHMQARDRSHRVLLARCGPANVAQLAHETGARALWLTEPYAGRVALEKALWLRLVTEAASHGRRWNQEWGLSRPAAGLHPSPVELFQLAEAARFSADAPLLLCLDPRPWSQPEHIAAWLATWARSAVFPRLKLALIDGEGVVAAAMGDPTLPIEVIGFSFGVGETQRALASLANDASAPQPAKLRALLGLASLASGAGDAPKAFSHCNEAERLVPSANSADRAEIAWMRGQTHYRAGDDAGAEQAFRTGIDQLPNDAHSPMLSQLCLGIANSLLGLGEHAEARDFYQTSSDLDRASGAWLPSLSARVWAAEAARRADETKLAEEELRALLAEASGLGPDFADGRAALEAQILERLARICDAASDRREEAHRLHSRAADCGCELHVPERP